MHEVDDDYLNRLRKAVIEAIFETGLDREANKTTVRSGEIVQVCLEVIAFVQPSAVTASPAKTREFTEDCSKRLRKLIVAAQGRSIFDLVRPHR
jgi:hypothetical protein